MTVQIIRTTSGLTFGHELDNQIVGTSWYRAMRILGKGL